MDRDKLVLFIGAAVCLVGVISLFEEVEEGGIFHLDHGCSRAAGGLLLVIRSLLVDATWTFLLPMIKMN